MVHNRIVRFLAGPAFSVAISFGIFVRTAFTFGLHRGISPQVQLIKTPVSRRAWKGSDDAALERFL
ncbi:MAG TPA: hypothetical protein VE131_15160, partial [Terriglobales bacterium]|nr:hypothetical protein [Terriglobales bacterium]